MTAITRLAAATALAAALDVPLMVGALTACLDD